MPQPFDDIAAELLELLADGALNADPVARAQLQALAGHCIVVRVDGTRREFALRITEQGLRMETAVPMNPSVTLTARPAALWSMLRGEHRADSRIDGDESVLQAFAAIVRNVRPDPAVALDGVLGPQAADALADTIDLGLAAARTLTDALFEAGERFVRARGRRYFLSRDDYERFIERAYRLRLGMDRIEARLMQFEARQSRGER
jgi:ubiquinone biosynthesis protein UbiJ